MKSKKSFCRQQNNYIKIKQGYENNQQFIIQCIKCQKWIESKIYHCVMIGKDRSFSIRDVQQSILKKWAFNKSESKNYEIKAPVKNCSTCRRKMVMLFFIFIAPPKRPVSEDYWPGLLRIKLLLLQNNRLERFLLIPGWQQFDHQKTAGLWESSL